jgi:hemolysin activation/secretion protein
VWPLLLGAALAYEDYSTSGGRGRRPPIQDRFTSDTAPGLGVDPQFVHMAATAAIDTRPAAGYARRGSLLQAEYHAYQDRADTFSFDRLDATIVQHVPIFRENWVLSMRGMMQSTLNDNDQVPFFLLPSLGSGSTLRAYPTGRFRDRHALLLQAEWRWIVNRTGLDMALFYDAGKVADRRSGLALNGMKSNVGIGVRFHGPAMTPLRVELARGREGFNLVFAGGASF